MTTDAPDTGTTPDPATDPTTTITPTPDTDPAALAAEVAKWKDLARKHEDRAKANAAAAKELEQVRQSAMTETEKAVAQARLEGRAEALRETGTRLVDAEFRTAAAGRPVDVDALLEGIDRARFIGEDGEPDRQAITAWVDRVAPTPSADDRARYVDLGQGARGSSTPLNGDPLTRDLKNLLGIR